MRKSFFGRSGLLGLVVGLFMVHSAVASAANQLSSPEELVKKASAGRAQFFEVMRDLEKNIPELRSRTEAEPYLYVLPELEKAASNLKLDEMAGSVFKDTARRLTIHSLRWIHLDKDATDVVLRYHRYADEIGAYEVVERLQTSISNVLPGNRTLAVQNLAALDAWATSLNMQTFLIAGYREVRSTLAISVLKDVNSFGTDERRFWLSQLATNTGIASFLTAQQNVILGLSVDQKDALHQMTEILVDTNAAILAQPFNVDRYLYTQLSDMARETVARFVRFEVIFNEGEMTRLLSLLDRAQLQGITYTLTDPNRLPSASYIPQFLSLAKSISDLLGAKGLTIEQDALKQYLGKLAGQYTASTELLEGTYKVKTPDGKVWRFTLAFARHDMLVAGIGQEEGLVYFAYYNISYDSVTDSYVASERSPSEDTVRNNVIRFKFEDNDGITGVLENVPGKGRMAFKGKRTEKYTDYLNDTTIPNASQIVDGAYTGTMRCGGFNKSATLYVNTVNNYQIGRLSFDKEAFFIELPFGLRKDTKGIVYVTSARLNSRSFVQFRGIVKDDVLTGEYIIGGQGQSCKNVVLKKVK